VKFLPRVLSAVFLAFGVFAVPAAAHAAPSGLVPLTPATQEIKPGENVALLLGVKNTDAAAVKGVVVNIRVDAGFDLPKEFTNCRYYRDGDLEGAWCSLAQSVGAGKAYALANFHVAAAAHAQRLGPIVFQWYSASWAQSQDGIESLAKGNSGDGQSSTAGEGGELTLSTSTLKAAKRPQPIGSVYLKLITSTATPKAPQPSRSATSSKSSKGGGSALHLKDGDGGMSTGAMIAVSAGIVVVLLAAGGVGFLFLRRRGRLE
jgi:hypothetical protein